MTTLPAITITVLALVLAFAALVYIALVALASATLADDLIRGRIEALAFALTISLINAALVIFAIMHVVRYYLNLL